MKKTFTLVFIFTISTFCLPAQDLHFSQFNEQPALVNPALTGATATSRSSVAYRNQWRSISSPFTTYAVSSETRFNSNEWQQVDKFRSMTFKERTSSRLAAGFSVYKDNAGDGRMGTTQINLSFATFVPSGKKSFIAVGLQASLVQTMLNSDKLIFPNQYNGSGYDASMSNNEHFTGQNNIYGDFAGGVLWTYGQNDKSLLGKKQLKANVGFSVYHLNRPQGIFQNTRPERSLKYVTHGDLLVSLTDPDFALAPSFLVQMRGSSIEILAGTLLKRYVKLDSKYTGLVKRSSLGIGIYYRNKDAAIFCMNIEIKEQCIIGMSYDLNVSRLTKGTNARGGVELTLKYTSPRSFLYQRKAKTE